MSNRESVYAFLLNAFLSRALKGLLTHVLIGDRYKKKILGFSFDRGVHFLTLFHLIIHLAECYCRYLAQMIGLLGAPNLFVAR